MLVMLSVCGGVLGATSPHLYQGTPALSCVFMCVQAWGGACLLIEVIHSEAEPLLVHHLLRLTGLSREEQGRAGKHPKEQPHQTGQGRAGSHTALRALLGHLGHSHSLGLYGAGQATQRLTVEDHTGSRDYHMEAYNRSSGLAAEEPGCPSNSCPPGCLPPQPLSSKDACAQCMVYMYKIPL